ncbi:MAG TPA: hypothetical protein VKL99_15560 [Candidatus Angelobacter sp.]|nr:hypothetical protein [Candidatus Angelobacter sp.]
MARWITFDQKTFSLLHARLAQGTTIETFGRGAVDYALAKPGAVVAVLPAFGDDVGLAIFRRPQSRQAMAPSKPVQAATRPLPKNAAHPIAVNADARPISAHASTRAGGFLGLSDEPVYEEEQAQGKKGWWRRFWDE